MDEIVERFKVEPANGELLPLSQLIIGESAEGKVFDHDAATIIPNFAAYATVRFQCRPAKLHWLSPLKWF